MTKVADLSQLLVQYIRPKEAAMKAQMPETHPCEFHRMIAEAIVAVCKVLGVVEVEVLPCVYYSGGDSEYVVCITRLHEAGIKVTPIKEIK